MVPLPTATSETDIQTHSKYSDMKKSPDTSWKSYTNNEYHYKFSYPENSSFKTIDGTHLRIVMPVEPNTDLSELYVDASSVKVVLGEPFSTLKDLTIGNNNFSLTEGGSAGAGNYYVERLYSSIHSELILSFHFVIHSVNEGMFDPPLRQFDQKKVDKMIYNTLSTLIWF
jgi:hypothetical protein